MIKLSSHILQHQKKTKRKKLNKDKKERNVKIKQYGSTDHILRCHFPKGNQLHKIFNRNTIKISYFCMKNMGSIISSHNKQILQPNDGNFGCNFRINRECPLENKCPMENRVYEVTITSNFKLQ